MLDEIPVEVVLWLVEVEVVLVVVVVELDEVTVLDEFVVRVVVV